jgi:hypothetical protein
MQLAVVEASVHVLCPVLSKGSDRIDELTTNAVVFIRCIWEPGLDGWEPGLDGRLGVTVIIIALIFELPDSSLYKHFYPVAWANHQGTRNTWRSPSTYIGKGGKKWICGLQTTTSQDKVMLAGQTRIGLVPVALGIIQVEPALGKHMLGKGNQGTVALGTPTFCIGTLCTLTLTLSMHGKCTLDVFVDQSRIQ